MSKPSPSFAPVYAAALYPDLARIARSHGYALAVHGSLQRDFDLIAIPWAEGVTTHEAMIAAIEAEFALRRIGEPERKPNGRVAYTLAVGFGECAIDLQFTPFARSSQ